MVVAVGLLASAMLMTETLSKTDHSKYMSLASVLASEKLEDLSRWPNTDPHVFVPGGGTAGSLTSDDSQAIAIGPTVTQVNYYDDVTISVAGGSFSETVSTTDGGGNTTYTTTTHSPDGITSNTANNAPNRVSFKRRWMVEQDVPVAGVRRITVRVATVPGSGVPSVMFELSMVK